MSTPEMPHAQNPVAAGTGVVSSGWLGSKSIFDEDDPKQKWRTAKAQITSVVVHVGVVAIFIAAYINRAAIIQEIKPDEPLKYEVVFLEAKGPGGGGGGSPKPAPPKQVEVPKPATPPPPVPVPTPAVPPPPSLTAPVMTMPNAVLQASGAVVGAIALPTGGGGQGTGIGTGNGSGIGPGTGGGFGGGAYRPGNGVESPVRIREEKPQYTPEAMRAKIQGTVELEALIGVDGKVEDAHVTRSLDRVFGLDEQARKAVMKTPFIPCKKEGKPVPCLVTFELQFTLR